MAEPVRLSVCACESTLLDREGRSHGGRGWLELLCCLVYILAGLSHPFTQGFAVRKIEQAKELQAVACIRRKTTHSLTDTHDMT